MPEAVRSLVVGHAALAVVATLAAVAAAALFHLRRAWFARAAAVAAVALALAFATGMRLDAPYRTFARQRLFVASSTLGWLFERKLHASVAALGLALVAAAAFAAAADLPPEAAQPARRAARFASLAAAAFALFATAASFAVAPHVAFR
jgi:hypothetical protein